MQGTVYVGDLDPMTGEAELYEHFKEIGTIVSTHVCRDHRTNNSLCYAYVNYSNAENAELSIEKLNTTKLGNAFIRVCAVERDPSARRAGKGNIVVRNLPDGCENPDLKDLFGGFGRITSMRVPRKADGAIMGYAFVNYESVTSSEQAIKDRNGTEVNGKIITVEHYRSDYSDEKKKNFTNLYIRGFRAEITDAKLRDIMSKYGEPENVGIRGLDARTNEEEKKRGFGFCSFKIHEQAVKAIDDLDGKIIPELCYEDVPLAVARFKSKTERQRESEEKKKLKRIEFAKYPNLYVKQFGPDVTTDNLKEVFSRYGETKSVRVMRNRETGVSREFGFVSVADQATADACIQNLKGSLVFGSVPLYVALAETMDERDRHRRERQFRGPQAGFPPSMMGMNPQGMFGQMGGNMPPHMGGGMRGGNPMMMNNNMMRGPPQGPPRPRPNQRPPPHNFPPQHQQPGMHTQQAPLASVINQMSEEEARQAMGERLYAKVMSINNEHAAKITGMLLEMDRNDILNMLETEAELEEKVNEALEVLQQHGNM